MKSSKGFTLIELLVSIAIISTLASIALPNYLSYIHRAHTSGCSANRYNMEMAESDYFMQNGIRRLSPLSSAECPSGGVYMWLIIDALDQDAPDYLKIRCSIHSEHEEEKKEKEDNEVLFSSDLDSMDLLTRLRGKWKIRDGDLVPTGKGENRLGFGDDSWTDYEITAKALLTSGRGYGIYYRADGKRNISGYIFKYDPGYGKGKDKGKGAFLVSKVDKGKEKSPSQLFWMPDDFDVFGKSHDITISVNGDKHSIKIDGKELFSFNDDTFSSGSAGFESWKGSQVNFQEVIVSEID